MFGKTAVAVSRVSRRLLLVLTAAVGLARLGLSLAGVPDDGVRWLSMNVLMWTGAVYYGVAVHARGFGSYKQILPLVFFQVLILHVIAVAGIVLSIAGFPNIFAAPEYSGPATPQNQWLHAAVPPDDRDGGRPARAVGRRDRSRCGSRRRPRADRPSPRRGGLGERAWLLDDAHFVVTRPLSYGGESSGPQMGRRPWMMRISTITMAITSSRWMKPPMV